VGAGPAKYGKMKNQFKNEEIKDILFVITYAGHTPAWPE
jgi:hypothetical protein